MKEIRLKPISEPVRDIQELEAYLLSVLRKYFYAPMMKELGIRSIQNSKGGLLEAIESGTLRYSGTGFVGKFTARTSKALKDLGAKWTRGVWEIPTEALSVDIQRAIYSQAAKDKVLKEKFAGITIEVPADKLNLKRPFDKVTRKVEQEIHRSFPENVKRLIISPRPSPAAKDVIEKTYTENLKLAIRDFSKDEVVRLRKQVEEHVFNGDRYESLTDILKQSFGIAKRKAKFLARQETNLLTAKLTEQRYAEAGVDDYEWRIVTGTEAHPVRKMHRALDKTKQKFSRPPITNPQGNRNNPKQDYNCRCVAIPILKLSSK